MKPISGTKAGGGVPLYQLKITLQWSKPAIWRRVVVRADLTLDRLHQVIQRVMPWTDSHMHQFILGKTYYGVTNQEGGDMGGETLNEKRHTLAGIVPAAKGKFSYEYDFGDGWLHDLTVEKVLPPGANFKHPVCLAGKNACPPDDCGGLPGYYNLLEVLGDPENPEHDEMKDWLGGEWDAAWFDLAAVNRGLKQLKA